MKSPLPRVKRLGWEGMPRPEANAEWIPSVPFHGKMTFVAPYWDHGSQRWGDIVDMDDGKGPRPDWSVWAEHER